MTDFTPGHIITRENKLWDGDRPSWLRDDARVMFLKDGDNFWYGDPNNCGHITFCGEDIGSEETAIRLDASDIVYQCIAWNEAHPDEPVMWPWYGGDEAPADWDGAATLRGDGQLRAFHPDEVYMWEREEPLDSAETIGYQRRPTTSLPGSMEAKASRLEEAARALAQVAYHGTLAAWSDETRAYWLGRVNVALYSPHEDAPTTSLPEPAEEIHTSGYAETIEESPEDLAKGIEGMARHWAAEAGGVFSTAEEVATLCKALARMCLPDPTPLDIAKAEHPDIPAEIVERIAAIVTKGEMK
ncbi:hypothetical protein ABIC65_001043 [Sphingomonas trueperi]|uniref:hypothetical protein n=1 Tax=Sphingomonas trueperi TaxID=53317 RepID=UPI003392A911